MESAAIKKITLSVNKFRLAADSSKEVQLEIYSKLCNVTKIQIFQKKIPPYKLLVQQILLFTNQFDYINTQQIPFHEILGYKEKYDNEKYKALILLMDKEYSEPHYLFFIEAFSVSDFNDEQFTKAIYIFLRYAPNNEFVDKVLLFLNQEILNPLCRNGYLDFVKQYIGNKQTNIN